MKTKILTLLLGLLCCLPAMAEVTNITLDKTQLDLKVGESVKLGITVQADSEYTITYYSSKDEVATVSAEGVITARGEGETFIYLEAFSEDVPDKIAQAFCVVTVTMPDGCFIIGEFMCHWDERRFHEDEIRIDGFVFPNEAGETLTIPGTLPYQGKERPVSMILWDAFAGNENIKSIVIEPGDGELYLGNCCFANIPFTSLTIDRDFDWQHGQAYQAPFKFEGSAPMATLTLGDNMTIVNSYAFDYVGSRFNNVTMGDNITRIETWGMPNFTNATNLKLPRNLEFIGSEALKKWYKIKSLVIPASVKTIASYAFASCLAVETLEFEGDDESIEIGDHAFDWLFNLNYITVHWKNPVLIQPKTFFRPASDTPAALNVPQGSVRAYSQADVWNKLSFITDGTESWPHAVTVNIPDHAAFTVYEQIAPLNLNIKANDDWEVHSLSHNGADVKSLLDTDGNYTIDGADATKHNLNVVFEKNAITGIEDIDNDFDDILVTVSDGVIHITGCPADALAKLYNTSSTLIYTGKERTIRIFEHGVYILCIGHRTFKLQL